MVRIRTPVFFLAVALLTVSTSVSFALDENAAAQVIQKFLDSNRTAEATSEAAEHAIADIDADGKADIVLLWNSMGPTSAQAKLTVFLDQGKTYRAMTTNLTGNPQKLSVSGPTITVDTLTLGPRDPLCCPTVKKRLQFRWQSGKLVGLR